MKVRCKNNIRDNTWNFLLYKVNDVYEAEFVVTVEKDYVKVNNEISGYKLFSFKSFSENFKILYEGVKYESKVSG